MIRVQNYTDDYRSDIIRLVGDFHEKYAKEFYSEVVPGNLEKTIDSFCGDGSKCGFILIVDGRCVGLMAGVEIRSVINDQKVFQEIIWYVEPPHGHLGMYLVDEASRLLKSDGFSSIIMAVVENDRSARIENIYRKFGFKKIETHYMRTL